MVFVGPGCSGVAVVAEMGIVVDVAAVVVGGDLAFVVVRVCVSDRVCVFVCLCVCVYVRLCLSAIYINFIISHQTLANLSRAAAAAASSSAASSARAAAE